MTVRPDAPDYSRPSVDIERRADADWQWGVTHTVRPEKLGPILPDVEYSITVRVQRRLPAAVLEANFADLYARAMTLADARCHAFARQDEGVHHRVICHAWRTVPAGSSCLALAIVMLGLMRPTAGRMRPPGKPPATREELMTAGGATMEELQQRSPQRATEVVVEFDHRDPAASGSPLFMYSYGERVAGDTVESFEPFVRRAETDARAHQALPDVSGAPAAPLSISHREWYIAGNLVTVELHLTP